MNGGSNAYLPPPPPLPPLQQQQYPMQQQLQQQPQMQQQLQPPQQLQQQQHLQIQQHGGAPEAFPHPRGQVPMIQKAHSSKREMKKFTREVNLAEACMTTEYVNWSEQTIHFS